MRTISAYRLPVKSAGSDASFGRPTVWTRSSSQRSERKLVVRRFVDLIVPVQYPSEVPAVIAADVRALLRGIAQWIDAPGVIDRRVI